MSGELEGWTVERCDAVLKDGFTYSPNAHVLRALRAALVELEASKARERERTREAFRWCYRALLALAGRCLEGRRRRDRGPDECGWPGDQEWSDLVGSSHSIFLHEARAEAGIPHEQFLERVRSLEERYDVTDLYDLASELGLEALRRGDSQ